MAKVTITLEDSVNEEGKPSLIVIPDFHGEEPDESSVAQAWAASLLEIIIENSSETKFVDEEAPSGAEADLDKH